MKPYTVSLIGAGKVAGALCRRFHETGIRVRSIVTRTPSKGNQLASECGADWSTGLRFPAADDIIIVAVPDDSLTEVLSGIDVRENTIVAHTAGSLGLEVFPPDIKRTGVFYPLQTFSQGRNIDFAGLPFFLEASDASVLHILSDLAELTGGTAHQINGYQRRLLHTAAVFVNNFTNHMLTSGKIIIENAGLSFSLLEPLVRETIDKALKMGPENSQTGPAARADKGTVEKHINLLSFSPELQKVYIEITKAIMTHYKKSADDQL